MIGENLLLPEKVWEEISLVVALVFQWGVDCRHLIHEETSLLGKCTSLQILALPFGIPVECA